MAKAVVNKDTCIGCGACTSMCPVGAITMGSDNKATVDASKCIECSACAGGCPVSAIKA
jgi:Fe-S-cluster-containing hydrogenase component 2